MAEAKSTARNVLGEALEACCHAPRTGFFRDGFCHTDARDLGRHTVCAEVTAGFLAFSREQGNDLVTPRPEFGFPGLKPGDRWCLCAGRWREAWEAGHAPRVILAACEASSLEVIPLEILREHAAAAHH